MKMNSVKHFALLLALVAISSTATAQLVWDGTPSTWTHGTGTATDPYLIETPQNLAWLSEMVNSGMTYSGVYFKQTADFNMNGSTYLFNAIGANRISAYFAGNYDGDFKSISNLVVSDLTSYVGLFGAAVNATFQKICVKGISGSGIENSTTYAYLGAICAYASSCSLIKCSCIGDVFQTDASSTNTSTLYMGGLVGYMQSTTIEQCFMKGNVTSATYYARGCYGGLVAYVYTSGSGASSAINACFFIGNVAVSGIHYSSSTATMGLMIGGGYNYLGGDWCYLTNCYAVGGFTYPSYYSTDDVMIGDISQLLTCNFNSYCGANLPTSSSCAVYRTDAYMKSAVMPNILNSGLDSTVFYYDSLNVNNGYPIFGYFAPPSSYWVNVTYDANRGSVSGMGCYVSGSTATLQAEASEGYVFTGWGDGNVENPRTVTVSSDSTFNAIFTKNAWTIHVKQNCHVTVQ